MHCRVQGCIANTDWPYAGTPACMQGFGGSPELAAATFKDCMFRTAQNAGVAKQVDAPGLNPDKLSVQVRPPAPDQSLEIARLKNKISVAIATISHLNDILVGDPDHDIALAAETQLILRDLRAHSDQLKT